jgi:hypothetical protein
MASRKGWTGRVAIGAAAVLALIAAMTLPGLAAPNKTMTFQVNSTGPTTADFTGAVNTAPASTSNVSFWVRATNTTPGTGNPNSLRITAPTTPSPGFVITGAVVDNANSSRTSNPTVVFGPSGAYVDLNRISPLQNTQFITVRITATTPAASCPGPVMSNDWKGVMYTGDTVGGGQAFNTTVSSGTKTTLTSGTCGTLEFVTAPHDAATDTDITGTNFDPTGDDVQVAFKVNGSISTALDGSTVTISEDGPGAISGNTGTLSGGLADFPNLQIDTAGDYNLTATVSGGPSSDPVAITITPTGVCPDGVSGQEDFTTSEFEVPGQGTLNISGLTSSECLGLDVSFSTDPETGAQQWDILVNKLTVGPKLTGYATWTWDLPGNEPVPWTKVKWKANIDGTLQETNFVDLPRCNAGAVTDPLPSPTLPNPAYEALFPTVTTSLGDLTAGVCMYDSALHVSGNTYNEVQKIAIFEDPSGRK